MEMHDMAKEHDTFWHKDQLILTFHSDTHFDPTNPNEGGRKIVADLGLKEKLPLLNQYLQLNGIDYSLSYFGSPKVRLGIPPRQTFTPLPGFFIFDVSTSEIEPTYGIVKTSIVGFFNFRNNNGKSEQSNTTADNAIINAVNLINGKLEELNQGLELKPGLDLQISISSASPHLLCGGTPSNTQGCPLTPPIPIEDDCALWHFKFSKLTPDELQKMTGKGVTVFVLDSLPPLEAIKEAAEKAGDDNLLLLDVYKNVKFHEDVPGIPIVSPDGTEPVTVGKDVYGSHFPMIMPDHGLYIAGIVRDLVPEASVECIRVLNKYCVGDMYTLTQALVYIESRMSLGGDLYHQPVVINMSLVIPTKEELDPKGKGIHFGNHDNDAYTCVRQQIQNLVGLDAVIVAAAGNEGDLRENRTGKHPGALYPAAFANHPYSIDGIIPVGAVNSKGEVASYSCYPGPRGIATYGGEVPKVTPKKPDPNKPPIVTVSDAVRGVYSSVYPPLIAPPPGKNVQYKKAPNDHAWAYWVGTSFATPVISAVAARILDWKSKGGSVPNVHDAVIAAAGKRKIKWENLDPATTGVSSGTIDGPVISAMQSCKLEDVDDEEEEKK